MSGKCRPSLRPKTLYNVDRSSLSTTDKECIHSVFELADHQKSEIEKNEKIIKAANDLIETQKAEIERFEQIETTINAFWNELQKLSIAKGKETPTLEELLEYIEQVKAEAIKEFAKKVELEIVLPLPHRRELQNLVKEMVGDTE